MYKTLFVVDDDVSLLGLPSNTLTFETYLRDYPKLGEPKIRIINLCDTERYLSKGYYCSLLAEARQHQVLPSVKVINALRSQKNSGLWLNSTLLAGLSGDQASDDAHIICMGAVADERFKKIASKAFQQFPAPLLEMTLSGSDIQLSRYSLSALTPEQLCFALRVMDDYARVSWQKKGSGKKYRWDLAILVDPREKVPPSDKRAISRFIKAAEKFGIRAQTITADELNHLNRFDGLFIRETTAIDHHTYHLACEAEENDLVVIDDPSSILRCCNKVYLHDAFNYKKVPSLKTQVITDASDSTMESIEAEFGFPVVLKLPEGSFSKGVFKAGSRGELKMLLDQLFQESALLLVQEYMFTDYDWRIGVLNGRALYACRYYMARNHWQIYNHGSKRNFSGGFDTLPTFEVPRVVLDVALNAAEIVGNGLYGIDIKEVDGRAYVIEVNDNPSIDSDVEDLYLGEELYMQIMNEFLRRFEQRGR